MISGKTEIQVEGRSVRWNFKPCLVNVEDALRSIPATGYHTCGSKHRLSVHQKELATLTDADRGGGRGGSKFSTLGTKCPKARSSLASVEQGTPWDLRCKLKVKPFAGS